VGTAVLGSLLSPVVLAFALGVAAAMLRSEIRFAEPVHSAIASYLLLAIGLKGGIGLRAAAPSEVLLPLGVTLVLGVVSPLVAWWFVGLVMRGLQRADRGALSAHYGSTSLVTFTAALTVVEDRGLDAPGYLPTLLAVLEVPGILIGLALAVGAGAGGRRALAAALGEVSRSRSVVLLLGGLVVGAAAGPERYASVEPLFGALFQGLLLLFLLDLGVMAGERLREVRRAGVGLLGVALVLPVVNGTLGVVGGALAGLPVGGAALLGVLVGSASYIAAPAAVRLALPQASPALALTASLGITFPFNLTVGIPLMITLAERLVPLLA
jgi:hypothetical protein